MISEHQGDSWKSTTLEHCGRWISGGTPSRDRSDFWNGTVPWISAKSMNCIRLSDSEERVTHLGAENGAKFASKGSILILVRGSMLHQRIPIGITTKDVTFNQDVKAIVPYSDVLPEFLLYWLLSNESKLLEMVEFTGIGAGKLSTDLLYNMEVKLPPLFEQRAIARFLGTLDDKIELNRRTNENMESIARAIFKSWFVDFDPVRAKAEGREPAGMDAETAALFSDSFEETELGIVPKGWKIVSLPNLIDINPPRSLRKGAVAPYLDMANMPLRGHVPDIVTPRPFGSGMRFINGDTLVARITPCLENGKTAYVDFLKDEEVGWGSTEYIVLRPKLPIPTEFAYCLARSQEFREFAIQNMTGTSGRQRVPAQALTHFSLISPPSIVSEHFGHLVKPLFAMASKLIIESRTLAALREVLMPKFLSGEIKANVQPYSGIKS